MARISTVLTRLLFWLLAALFAVQIYLAATRPVTTAEAFGYDRFVRPTWREIMAAEQGSPEILYSLLEKRSVGLFHVSRLSLRLPSLLSGLALLWAASRFGHPLGFAVAFLPLAWGCFSRASGLGLAVVLGAWAVVMLREYLVLKEPFNSRKLNYAGSLLGLSLAASWRFAAGACVLALIFLVLLAVRNRLRWETAVEQFAIPAVGAAFIFLILPWTHASAARGMPPPLEPAQLARVGTLVEALRSSAGSAPVRVGASASLAPILNFYRSQDRLTNWQRVSENLEDNFDYYALAGLDSALADQRNLLVLYRDSGLVLARSSPARRQP